jgi:hypothetical protein
LTLTGYPKPQNPRAGEGSTLLGWFPDLEQQASHAANGMPAGTTQAFNLKCGEFLGDFWHTNKHIQNNELG